MGRTTLRDSIVVSISACHADDPGSIPGRGVLFLDANCALRSEAFLRLQYFERQKCTRRPSYAYNISKDKNAPAGNRTRVTTMATLYSTTRPRVLDACLQLDQKQM